MQEHTQRQDGFSTSSFSKIAIVQAPQSPSAQPSLVPVLPVALNHSRTVIVGDTPVTTTALPLSSNFPCIPTPSVPRIHYTFFREQTETISLFVQLQRDEVIACDKKRSRELEYPSEELSSVKRTASRVASASRLRPFRPHRS